MASAHSDHYGLVEAVAAMNVADPLTASPTGRNESKNEGSEGLDSGYASQSSTPDSLKSTFVDHAATSGKNIWPHRFRKPKQLRAYDKPIPQLTWDRFSDLREQYAENLNRFTRSLPDCPSVLMTLQVLGEDEETAEPWVFVQCDKAVLKKINNFFKQPLIKMDFEPLRPNERSPRLRVLVCPLKPRQLAKVSSQDDPLANGDLVEIFADEAGMSTRTLCGIQIRNENLHGIRQATMGGIIKVVDKKGITELFGMTAGHFLLQQSYDESEYEASDDLDDEFYAEESFELDLSSLEADIEEEDETLPHSEAGGKRAKQADLKNWSKVGKLSEASHTSLEDGRNLDWALITIDYRYFNWPNLPYTYLDQFGECKSSGSETNVFMISARGQERGTLSSSWSYMMLPPGNVLVRTHLLSFPDGNSLQSGDSGAWVQDSVTYKVYGHVVASDVFGHGYVVPICDSFEDIKNRLSADSVSLPSLVDFHTFHRRSTQIDATSSVIYQSNVVEEQVLPEIYVGLQTTMVPLQFEEMPEYPRQSHNSSGTMEYPPSSFSSRYDSSSYVPGSYYHAYQSSHKYDARRRPISQAPDSGYSSLNTTPNHSPPVSPPQILQTSEPSQDPRGYRRSEATASNRHSGSTSFERPRVVGKPIDPESDPTGELRAQKFDEMVRFSKR